MNATHPSPGEGHTWSETRRLVLHTLRAGVSALVTGHPGVGKSAMARAVADDLGLAMVDIRLAQSDPTDLAGVWFPDRERQVLASYPPAWAIQASEQPMLVFLDEINAAVTRLHQAAAYQIVLERRVGTLPLHPDTVVLAAGNLEEDRALVTPLSAALANRFAHFVLRVDADTWLAWADREGVHPEVCAYVGRHGEEVLYAPDDDGGQAFPTPRAWEMASRLILGAEEPDHARLVAACVGPAAAARFEAWRRISRAVDADAIVLRGKRIRFDTPNHADPSFVYAATYAVADRLRHGAEVPDEALPHVVRFLGSRGLDPEFAFLFLRRIRSNESLWQRLGALPAFREVVSKVNAHRLGEGETS